MKVWCNDPAAYSCCTAKQTKISFVISTFCIKIDSNRYFEVCDLKKLSVRSYNLIENQPLQNKQGMTDWVAV